MRSYGTYGACPLVRLFSTCVGRIRLAEGVFTAPKLWRVDLAPYLRGMVWLVPAVRAVFWTHYPNIACGRTQKPNHRDIGVNAVPSRREIRRERTPLRLTTL